jgi:penicillin G amidase
MATGLGDMMREVARAALPPVEGAVRLPGLREEVEVIRDRWGVPHVYAANEEDLWFAQGYLVTSERLFQLDALLRLGTGRLAELLSDLALPIDRFVRTAGWNRAGRRIAGSWDDRSVEMARAYWAGTRAWMETRPGNPVEYHILQAEPELPGEDEAMAAAAAAGVFMAWSLSANWDAELLRAEIAEVLGPEAIGTLFPDLDTEAAVVRAGREFTHPARMDLLERSVLPPSGQGSNNWVVSGNRTTSGKPLLANDPHLMVSLPSIWYELHLEAPGFRAAGVALPFSPGIVIGHNDRVAWGFTNVQGDTQDLYLERLSDDGTEAECGDGPENVTVHREEIRVRGRDEPEVLEVRETRHGPILDSYLVGVADPVAVMGGVTRPYALRWVGHDRGIQPSTLYGLNTATDWDEFRAAAKGWECPGQNMLYADVEGNIGYQVTGLYPIRRSGDGTLPVPGWTDEFEWEGWIPYDELPRALNPAEGFLCTANNKPHDDGYPHLLGRDFLPPFRARRIAQMITEHDRHDRDTFARMQMDTRSLPAARMVPQLVSIEPADDRQKEALALLGEWDFDLAADSAPAAIYEVWCEHIARRVLLPKLGDRLYEHFHGRRQWTNAFQYQVLPNLLEYPTALWFGGEGFTARDGLLREALDDALGELTGALGEDMGGWRWGGLHKAKFAGRLAIIPDLADLFTAGEVEMGGDEQTVNQGMYEPGFSYDVVVAPSWRQILDPSDWDASVGTHTVGQSGNPASPHFADLLELWGSGKHHPLPWSRDAVEGEAEAALRLQPAD